MLIRELPAVLIRVLPAVLIRELLAVLIRELRQKDQPCDVVVVGGHSGDLGVVGGASPGEPWQIIAV